ncbi:MAG: MFS transporter [Alphaproteobacteria bacterium]|nr:MFS transporter [Alphaproteobacteria bacterium]MCW5741261.1 MFS transporter [Alphaproteobacteria bacterium]
MTVVVLANLRAFAPSLGVMLGVQSMVSVGAAAIAVLAPVIAPEAGVAPSNIGIYTMALFGCGMASALIGGALVPRFGPVRVCQISLLMGAVALGLALSGHVAGLMLCAVIMGLGMGAPTPASSHLLFRVTPSRVLGTVLSIKQTGVPLGGALAGAILPGVTLMWGWRGALVAVAVATVLSVLAIQLWRQDMDSDRDPARPVSLPGLWGSMALIWRQPDLRLIALTAATLSAGQVSVSAFYVTYLVEIGLSLTAAGFALAVAQLSGVAGRVVWGAIADWSGRPLLVLTGLAIVAALATLAVTRLAVDWPSIGILALSVVLGATTIGWAGVVYGEVARRAPAGRTAEASGGITAFMFAGIVIGPAIFSAIVQAAGSFTPAYAVLAVAIAAIAAAMLWRLSQGGAR